VFETIAHDVFAVSHRLVDGKNTIVFGARGALAIDACNYPDEGEAMVAFIRARTDARYRLAITHGHGDHVLGSGAFHGADVYAHIAAPRTIDSYVAAWAERYFNGSIAQCESALARPNVLFDHEVHLDLGGKHVRLFATPGHCPDAVCAFVEEDGILCAGDTVVTGILPAITDGDSHQMEMTLHALLRLDARVLVPGHGPLLRGSSAIREHLLWTIGYLGGVRACVADALRRSASREQAIESAAYERFVGERLPDEPFGMRRRHRQVVTKIADEVTAGRA
jgi:glyoxylase-like metal-dependent hydrolase (beta-lactamase superfamily II)